MVPVKRYMSLVKRVKKVKMKKIWHQLGWHQSWTCRRQQPWSQARSEAFRAERDEQPQVAGKHVFKDQDHDIMKGEWSRILRGADSLWTLFIELFKKRAKESWGWGWNWNQDDEGRNKWGSGWIFSPHWCCRGGVVACYSVSPTHLLLKY